MSLTEPIYCPPRKGRRVTPVGDQTILANTPATIAVTLRDQDGEAIAGSGVTVSVVDSSGTNVITANSSASAVAGVPSAFTVAIPAHDVDALTATWTSSGVSVVTNIEIAGNFGFSLDQVRQLPSMDPAKYDTARLRSARQGTERVIERVCGASFVERYQSDLIRHGDLVFTSTFETRLRVPDPFTRRLVGIDLDGESMDLDGLEAVDRGLFIATGDAEDALNGEWSVATLRYVTGYTDRYPDDLSAAGAKAARARLISTDGSSGIPSRAAAVNGAPSVDLSPTDEDHPTGVREADLVICGWRDRIRNELGLAQ